MVYSTSLQTQSGSVIYVTNTIIQSASGTASNSGSTSSSDSNDKDESGKQKKKVNIGAVVGGVVGGVGGALVVGAAVLLIIRHTNKKREQERMEKEYQEAIKPVEYGDKFTHGRSSSVSINNGPSSGSFEEDRRNVSSNNPFDDSRRISNGSIINANSSGNQKILTVVNPDED